MLSYRGKDGPSSESCHMKYSLISLHGIVNEVINFFKLCVNQFYHKTEADNSRKTLVKFELYLAIISTI